MEKLFQIEIEGARQRRWALAQKMKELSKGYSIIYHVRRGESEKATKVSPGTTKPLMAGDQNESRNGLTVPSYSLGHVF